MAGRRSVAATSIAGVGVLTSVGRSAAGLAGDATADTATASSGTDGSETRGRPAPAGCQRIDGIGTRGIGASAGGPGCNGAAAGPGTGAARARSTGGELLNGTATGGTVSVTMACAGRADTASEAGGRAG